MDNTFDIPRFVIQCVRLGTKIKDLAYNNSRRKIINEEDAKRVGAWLYNRLTGEDLKKIVEEGTKLLPHPKQLILKPRITLWDIRCLQMGKFPPDEEVEGA